jgi:tetratricopeptide (TPR) repeat protein
LAEEYLELGYRNIEILEKAAYKTSYVNSYKSAFYGFRIAISPYLAPFLGSKSSDCAELAIKLDDKNPIGYFQLGNTKYHAPSLFGGSKDEALKYFIKAENLMQSNEKQIIEDWNYLDLLTTIAKTYTSLKNYVMAKAYYEKILKIEPGFLLVKNELYPEILKM